MRTLLTLGTIAILAFGLPAATAFECEDRPPSSPGVWQVTDGTAANTYYVDDRDLVTGNGVWIFEETNGIWTPKAPGVTRAPDLAHQDDLQAFYCAETIVPDCAGPYCAGDVLPDRLVL